MNGSRVIECVEPCIGMELNASESTVVKAICAGWEDVAPKYGKVDSILAPTAMFGPHYEFESRAE
jgi:hypothetical protein